MVIDCFSNQEVYQIIMTTKAQKMLRKLYMAYCTLQSILSFLINSCSLILSSLFFLHLVLVLTFLSSPSFWYLTRPSLSDRIVRFNDCLEERKDYLSKDPCIDECIEAIEMDRASSKADSETKSKTELVPVIDTIDWISMPSSSSMAKLGTTSAGL